MRLFSGAAIALAAIALSAPCFAKSMTDAAYIRAERCLAYSALPQLQGDGAPDVSGLTQIVSEQRTGRVELVTYTVKDEADKIKRAGRRAKKAEAIERLKTARAESCAGLITPSSEN